MGSFIDALLFMLSVVEGVVEFMLPLGGVAMGVVLVEPGVCCVVTPGVWSVVDPGVVV